MNKLELTRKHDIDHHITQARYWLEKSNEGKYTVPISYAAFEIRLASERIIWEYYRRLLVGEEGATNVRDLDSFKTMQNKIYSNAGHQHDIDKQFKYTNLLLKIAGVDVNIVTPNFGQLHHIWKDCSDPSHFFWNIAATTDMSNSDYDPYYDLVQYADELQEYVYSMGAWMRIKDQAIGKFMAALEDDDNTEQKLRDHFEEVGLYVEYVTADEEKTIVGTPIPPKPN